MVDLKFDAGGLLPVVAQDAGSGLVLMVAYMNREALDRTLSSGDVWYWSRSRGALWRKGETSGHTQRLKAIRVDCDSDALLVLVDQKGAACHTGQPSCFFRDIEVSEVGPPAVDDRAGDILERLFRLLKQRRAEMPAGSYTASLFRGGRAQIARKVLEEAEELTHAARDESDQRVVEEAADLLYHTWVLLVERGVELGSVRQELERRRHGR
jgi:phosphoribosyl-ATP pyrophosphohydrolase/phosphoribosyl-AMP cyclohydrolase